MKGFTSSIKQKGRFPLGEAAELVRDLLIPNPCIYWVDFLFHMSLG
jgi:hypothetical protein